MTKKVIQFPITYEQKKLNEHGEGYIPCLTSEKWLQFPESVNDERNIPVKVMAELDGKEKQLTQLVISKEDLLRAVNSLKIES